MWLSALHWSHSDKPPDSKWLDHYGLLLLLFIKTKLPQFVGGNFQGLVGKRIVFSLTAQLMPGGSFQGLVGKTDYFRSDSPVNGLRFPVSCE